MLQLFLFDEFWRLKNNFTKSSLLPSKPRDNAEFHGIWTIQLLKHISSLGIPIVMLENFTNKQEEVFHEESWIAKQVTVHLFEMQWNFCSEFCYHLLKDDCEFIKKRWEQKVLRSRWILYRYFLGTLWNNSSSSWRRQTFHELSFVFVLQED